MSDLARWTVAHEGGVVVVALTGEVDLSNATELEAELAAAIEGAAPAVVDLSGLDYLDSSGTRSLHRLAAGTAARRQPLALVAPPASTAFKNCSAAKAAGAARVRIGDPGYGRHLDSDGDGVGCES